MLIARFGFRLFVLTLLVAMGLAMFEWIERHPQDMPWTPLSLAEPVGRFTALKLSGLRDKPGECRALLDAAEQRYKVAPVVVGGPSCGYSDGVKLIASAGYDYVPRATLACPMAAGLFLWEQQVVQPAAQLHFGRAVARVDHFGSYSCRRIGGSGAGGWSEHATAGAIDIAGFRLRGGHRITVAADWAGNARDAAFLRAVRDGACRIFGTTLSPDYNAAHRDHLHLDLASRGGGHFCG